MWFLVVGEQVSWLKTIILEFNFFWLKSRAFDLSENRFLRKRQDFVVPYPVFDLEDFGQIVRVSFV